MKPVWVTKDGWFCFINKLPTDHLTNILNMIENGSFSRRLGVRVATRKELEAEARKRGLVRRAKMEWRTK